VTKIVPVGANLDPSYTEDAEMSAANGDDVTYFKRVRPDWNVAAPAVDRNLADLDAKRAALGLT
jgi:hypothetical protein